MKDKPSSGRTDTPELALLREIADGLQAAMNYLQAVRQASREGDDDPPGDPDLVGKAMEQVDRARQAYFPLHARLSRAARQDRDPGR